jgi:hypothetical protein
MPFDWNHTPQWVVADVERVRLIVDAVQDGRHLMHQEDADSFGTDVQTKELMPGGLRLDLDWERRRLRFAVAMVLAGEAVTRDLPARSAFIVQEGA